MGLQDITLFILGFGWYSILIFPFLKTALPWESRFERIDHTAVQVARALLFVYLFFWIVYVIKSLLAPELPDHTHITQKMFGEYWAYFWTTPFLIVLLAVLLSSKQLRYNLWLRPISGLVLIGFDAGQIIVVLTSMHRDHGPTDSTQHLIAEMLTSWLIKMVAFLILLTLVHGARVLINRIKVKGQ